MAVTDEAIDKIKLMILSRQVGPGEKLPKESELATLLGVSRSSLREAVRALSLVGVLNVRQGDGTYVTSLAPGLLLDTVSFVVDLLEDRNILELLDVRLLLEPSVTALAASRMEDAKLAHLRECMDRMESASDVDELLKADDEFHGTIMSACGNVFLASLLEVLSSRTMRARTWRGMTDREALERTKTGHRAIYQAVSTRNPELARAAAIMHISEVAFWFRQKLESADTAKQATESTRVASGG